MKSLNARSARLKIFSIAIIGGIGFCLYLFFNTTITRENESRIQDLISTKFNELQIATSLPAKVRGLNQKLADAIGLEDIWLLKEAEEQAQAIYSDLQLLANSHIFEHREKNIDALKTLPAEFNVYFKHNLDLAKKLVERPEDIVQYLDELERNKQVYKQVIDQTDFFSTTITVDYHEHLFEAQTLMKQSVDFGITGGIITAILLFGTALFVSRNVGAAIEDSDRLKNDFLTTMSHELRTPLNGIYGSLQLLKSGDHQDSRDTLTNTAWKATNELNDMIDQILHFTELRSDNPVFPTEVFDYQKHLAPLLEKYQAKAEAQQLVFLPTVDWKEELLIEAPWTPFIQSLEKLLSNSFKFTTDGQIKLRLKCIREKQGSQVLGEIIDSGSGISKDNKDKLFQSFQQLDGGFQRQHEGIGLGLATVLMQTQALNGTIEFDSVLELGSTFTLKIPVTILEQRNGDNKPENPPPTLPDQKDTKQPSPHFLVVEDNPINQMVISTFIRKLGCSSTCTANGQEALDWLTENPTTAQCILMDCQMPIMNGFDATIRIRNSQETYATIPIIAVTANAMAKDHAKCLEVGMNGYLSKPLALTELGEKLKALQIHIP